MLSLQTPEDIACTVATRIRSLRLARNLSQGDLAGMAEVSLSSIRRLEATRQGTLQLLAGVALALNATAGLAALFAFPTQTIAQAEAAASAGLHRRARKPARVGGGKR